MPDPVRPATGHLRAWTSMLPALALAALQVACAPAAVREPPAARPATAPSAALAYPATRRAPTEDAYPGGVVRDPWRWLEDLESPEVAAWVAAENAVTGPVLEGLPAREGLRRRLAAGWAYERTGASLTGGNAFTPPVSRAGRLFYLHNSGREDQSVLVVSDGPDGLPRVLLDPATLAADGTVSLVDFEVSPDGRHLAYATSDAGSDWRTIRIRTVETAEDLAEELTRVKSTPLSWAPRGDGFYYSRYPALDDARGDGTKQVSVWFHALGTPQSSDRFVYAISDHATRNPYATATDDGRWLVLSVQDGYAANAIYLLDLTARDSDALRLLDRWDGRYQYLGNRGREFFFATTADAPRGRIVAVDLDHPAPDRWRTIVAEAPETLDAARYAGGRFLLSYLRDAHSVLRVQGEQGRAEDIPLPGLGQVAGVAGHGDAAELYFAYTDFLTPHTVYRYEVASGRVAPFHAPAAGLDPARFVTEQVFLASRDGTRVPMFVTRRRDVPFDGRRPTMLYGYGGFNLPQLPAYSVPVATWLELGGVYAVANLRGGGEYGEAWHRAGTRAQKQNVFDDFVAAAEWLIANHVTSREHLAIRGRSNGGLLVGAVLVQRPDLFAAALPAVGVLDMLRYHTASANAAQWSSDYGRADEAADFASLRAYSPVHNVRAGVCYPPTLITTADHDDRVAPWHSFKFAAALQAAAPASCHNPLLLRVETRAGHGNDRPVWMQVEDYADQWAFAAKYTGLEVPPE